MHRVGVVFIVSVAMLATTSAQWLNHPTPGIPRLPNGKPDLAAKAPRTADGTPDLSGVWHTYAEPLEEKKKLFGQDFGTIFVPGMEPTTISKYAINLLLDYKPGEIAMTPAAETVFKLHNSGDPKQDFGAHCLPFGTPLATLLSEVHKIVQTPGLILVMYELDSMTRQIYTDGRKLPAEPNPSWLGYSVGRWDRDTLIVETNGLNDRAWLDLAGHPRSEAMRITERYRRRDVGHLDVEVTLDDPKMYSKPFTVKLTHLLQADTDILEYVCNENEKDRAHMPAK
jgi:hypothetical protein